MEINELKNQLLQGTFYFSMINMFFNSKVKEIKNIDNDGFNVIFDNGWITVDIKKMKKVNRPSEFIAKFNWCYKILNEDNKCIGYIGNKEE